MIFDRRRKTKRAKIRISFEPFLFNKKQGGAHSLCAPPREGSVVSDLESKSKHSHLLFYLWIGHLIASIVEITFFANLLLSAESRLVVWVAAAHALSLSEFVHYHFISFRFSSIFLIFESFLFFLYHFVSLLSAFVLIFQKMY